MNILIVDNEELALKSLVKTVESVVGKAEITAVSDPEEALKTARQRKPEIAFLDIEMPGMNGMTLAKKLKEQINPRMNIIFTTGYNEYIGEAFTRLRASGYLMKPITAGMIRKELEELRYPVELKGDKRLRVRCFGMFEIFIDEKPVSFHYSKTTELFAYLVDREGMVTTSELSENLWEGDDNAADHRSYLRNMISDLVKTLGGYGLKDVVIKKYGKIGLDATRLDCDYYEYKNGNPAAVNAFFGEYMTQYSWAENTLGSLVFMEEE